MTEENKDNLDALEQDVDSTDDVNDDALLDDDSYEEDEEESEDVAAKLKADYENQKIRAEKAERALKELKAKLESKPKPSAKTEKTEPQPNQTAPESLTREEAILYAKDLSIEQVEKAKKIAALEDIGLLEAVESDVYKAWAESDRKRQEKESAELPASSGSPKRKQKPSFQTANSKEEHQALWKRTMGL